jgi:hypothetical protein
MCPVIESESTRELARSSWRWKGAESWPEASCRRCGTVEEGVGRRGGSVGSGDGPLAQQR